ncbi:MAG: S8 family peptidase [Blastomonas sp.]
MMRRFMFLSALCAASMASQVQAADPPNDAYATSTGSWGQSYADQYWLERIGLGAGPDSAWRKLPDDAAPVTIAVIDTGLDWNHLDFDWANLWKNSGEIANNGKDDDGNGYVDDMFGWNFYDNSNRPWDHDGHGTFTTGIIAGTWNNGQGIAGINPKARIMVLRALNSFGNARASYLANAIVYATDNGARIINMSVGGPGLTQAETEAVRYAASKGVLIVVASGNEGSRVEDFGIAGMEEVITVGAAGLDGLRAPFSNYGRSVDLLAPGVDILSLRARRTDTLLDIPGADYTVGAAYVGEDKRYFRASGTSFAAPMVAGVASLLLSRDPTLSAADVRRILLNSARDVGAPGIDQFSGYGMLDAAAALSADAKDFVEAAIGGVAVVQGASGPALAVNGTIAASDLKSAYLEIGAGEDPQQWTRVLDNLQPVADGEIGQIPPNRFQGSTVWILRLTVIGASGQQREARFRLSLG